jgi:membrane protein implicated in regulation of membrane protease activity
MSVQTSASRPAAKSIGAAFVDIVITLVILVVTFLAFLIAPLLALAVAYLVYAVMRPRNKKKAQQAAALGGGGAAGGATPAGRPVSAHGFGAGTAT